MQLPEQVRDVLEAVELYVIAIVREATSSGVAQPPGRSAVTIAAREQLLSKLEALDDPKP